MRCLIFCFLLAWPGLARTQGPTTACKSNLKNLATALEMWASDHQGHYPQRLEQLTPIYIKEIPRCPAAGKDTYSLNYHRFTDPDDFGLCCSGSYHPSIVGANLPACTSSNGLRDRKPEWSKPDGCRAELARLGQALQLYRRHHKAYPTQLRALVPVYLTSLPSCPSGSFEYWSAGRVSCPSDAHLCAGLSYYQPQWAPASGVTQQDLKTERPILRPFADNQFKLFTLLGLLWFLLLVRMSGASARHEGGAR